MRRRPSYPLHIHLWLMFGSLVLAVGALTCGINFFMTKAALEAAASDATRRISRETLDDVVRLIAPAEVAVRMLSHSSLAEARTLAERLQRLPLVRDALDTTPVLQALYIGYADGDFFYVRPLRDADDRAVFSAPPAAAYIVRSVERDEARDGSAKQGRLYLLNAGMTVIEARDAPDFTARFDPRQRPWYTAAMESGALIRSEPYLFFSDRQAGATLAIPTANRRAVVGGDFRLDLLGQMLAGKETVARSVLALLDSSGRVVAIDRQLPDAVAAPDDIRTPFMAEPADYGIPVLTHLAGTAASLGADSRWQGRVSAGGETWYTAINRLAPGRGKPLFLVSALPQDELLGGARRRALAGLAVTALVLLLSIPVIWLLARHVSRPLHALLGAVEAIRGFDFARHIEIRSRVAEVNTLGVATEQMRQTIEELTRSQRDLFDAFIRILAGGIDAKSAHTGGHCERVPEIARMLAEAACAATDGPFRGFTMSAAEWESLHVAAWLHDCGKITTPEYIIDKATKLETIYDRLHEVRMRFEVLKRDAEIAYLRATAAGENDTAARQRRDAALAALDDDFAFVATCNQGGESMDAARRERLLRIAARTWLRTLDDRIGLSQEELERKARHPAAPLPAVEPLLADKPEHRIPRDAGDTIAPDNPWGFRLDIPESLYDRGELHNLLVVRGTLSAEERFKIEDHIVQTQIMLSRLPFPAHLRRVPEIAGSHHEKLDGSGYPRRLHREQISTLARMMAIADIFEALTSADRPYKKPKPLSEAIRIMATACAEQHIDGDLFHLFLEAGVYRRYAEQFMQPAQIDEVDIGQYLGRGVRSGTPRPAWAPSR